MSSISDPKKRRKSKFPAAAAAAPGQVKARRSRRGAAAEPIFLIIATIIARPGGAHQRAPSRAQRGADFFNHSSDYSEARGALAEPIFHLAARSAEPIFLIIAAIIARPRAAHLRAPSRAQRGADFFNHSSDYSEARGAHQRAPGRAQRGANSV